MKPVLLGSGINLIGLHGKAHSGKNEVAHYLTENYEKTYSEAFADPLKEACSHIFGIPLVLFNDVELKEVPFHYWQISPRVIAQYVGTELIRDQIDLMFPEGFPGQDFWVMRLAGKLNGDILLPDEGEYEAGDTVIVTDVRFQNEYDFILENGGCVIHVTRDGAEGEVGIPGHASEAGITFDSERNEQNYLLTNNHTLVDLYERIDEIMMLITKHQNKINHDFISSL